MFNNEDIELTELDLDLYIEEAAAYNDVMKDFDFVNDIDSQAGIQRISNMEFKEPFSIYMKKGNMDYLTFSIFGVESIPIFDCDPPTRDDKIFLKGLCTKIEYIGAPESCL